MSDHTSNIDVKMGSERSFGVVFAIVFGIIAAWPLKNGGDPRLWAGVVAGTFLAIAFIYPKILQPLNLIWFKFGLLLHKIVSPIIMGLLFFLTVTPIGLLLKLFGKDVLNQKLDRNSETYWITVDPAKAAQSSMRRQY